MVWNMGIKTVPVLCEAAGGRGFWLLIVLIGGCGERKLRGAMEVGEKAS